LSTAIDLPQQHAFIRTDRSALDFYGHAMHSARQNKKSGQPYQQA